MHSTGGGRGQKYRCCAAWCRLRALINEQAPDLFGRADCCCQICAWLPLFRVAQLHCDSSAGLCGDLRLLPDAPSDKCLPPAQLPEIHLRPPHFPSSARPPAPSHHHHHHHQVRRQPSWRATAPLGRVRAGVCRARHISGHHRRSLVVIRLAVARRSSSGGASASHSRPPQPELGALGRL